jgi:hypothetical protein
VTWPRAIGGPDLFHQPEPLRPSLGRRDQAQSSAVYVTAGRQRQAWEHDAGGRQHARWHLAPQVRFDLGNQGPGIVALCPFNHGGLSPSVAKTRVASRAW